MSGLKQRCCCCLHSSMEVVARSPSFPLRYPTIPVLQVPFIHLHIQINNISISEMHIPLITTFSQVSNCNCFSLTESRFSFSLTHNSNKLNKFSLGALPKISNTCFSQSWGFLRKRRKCNKDCSVKHASILFVRLVAGVVMAVSVSLASNSPSCEFYHMNLYWNLNSII